MRIRPINGRILVRIIKDSHMRAALILLAENKSFKKGIVEEVGDCTKLSIGDEVMFPYHAGSVIDQDGIYVILKEDEVWGVVGE